MLSNRPLKITSYDLSKRYFQSDNVNAYFSVSDFKDSNDGLFFKGFRLFSGIKPDFEKSKLISKQLSPLWINVNFSSNESIKYLLLKNGDGLLLCIKNRKFLTLKNRKYPMALKIEMLYEILEKNSNKIILKYRNETKNKSVENLYCGIIAVGGNSFENTRAAGTGLNFLIKPDIKEDEIKLYIHYNTSYDDLMRQIEYNASNIDSLKKKHMKNSMLPFRYSKFDIENKQFCKALNLAVLSSSSFIMKNDENIGIWAGYPYFLNNWGRDTFISLSGICLTSGRYEEAVHILENFTRHQCRIRKSADFGRIPNIVLDGKEVYYNSSDSTPLFIRAVYEYYLYTGSIEDVLSMWESIKFAVDGCYLSRKDKNNFIIQNDADDWMDAKKDGKYPYSPRGGYAVEIQSLWYTALSAVSLMLNETMKKEFTLPYDIDIAELKKYADLCSLEAGKLRTSFNGFFVLDEGKMLADHINADYTADKRIRPNALLAIFYSSLPGIKPLVDKNAAVSILNNLMPELVFKYGVSSLGKNDQLFHPHHISGKYSKDAAYHNGVIWNWLSGAFISAACASGLQDFSFYQTEELVKQLNTSGTLGELTDPALNGKGQTVQSGTFSQAWSVSEFCRSFYQNYLGIYPDVPKRTVYFFPSIPVELGMIKTSIRFGMHETILISIKADRNFNNISYVEMRGIKIIKPLVVIMKLRIGSEEKNGKFIVRFQYLKALIKDNGDSIRMSFIQNDFKQIKLRELSITGQGELSILKRGFGLFDQKSDISPSFASSINAQQAESFPVMKEQDYLEKHMMNYGRIPPI